MLPEPRPAPSGVFLATSSSPSGDAPCRRTSSSPRKASRSSRRSSSTSRPTQRREVAERIKEAREFGDISENSEYDDAKNEQAMLEARIAQLEEHAAPRARSIDEKDARHRRRRTSARSSTSRTRRPASRVKYTIVGSAEANPAENKLSNESPVGKALIGHKRGEIVSVQVPRGPARKLKITKIDVGLCRDERAEEQVSDLLAARRAQARAPARRRASIRSRTTSRASRRSPRCCAALRRAASPARRPTARYRVAGRLAARRGQGKMAFLDLVDRSGRIQLQARADVLGEEAYRARCVDLDLGDLVGVDGTIFRSRRGELSLRVDALRRCSPRPAPAARQVPRPHRRRDALPPPRARPDRQRGDRASCSSPRAKVDHRDPPLPRRARLRRGRDAGAAAALRRRAGAAVHHPPQRARPRLLPADRDRALPQAADRRRPRARLRARQGLPQRGRLAQAQPRVHDARVVRGLRRLRRTRWRALEQLVAAVARRRAATTGDLDFSAALARASRCATRSASATGDRHPRAPRPRRAARRRSRRRASRSATDGRTWPQLVDDLLSKHVEPKLIAADVRHRLPGRALAVRQGTTAPSRGSSSASRPSLGGMEIANAFTELNDPDEQRAPLRAAGARWRPSGDEEAQPYDEAFVAGARARDAADRRRRLGIDRLVMLLTGKRLDPRGRAVPGDARLSAARPLAGNAAASGNPEIPQAATGERSRPAAGRLAHAVVTEPNAHPRGRQGRKLG